MVIMMKNLSKNNNLLLLDILHKFIFSKKCGTSITDVDANKLELLCREADDNLLGALLYFYCGKDNILPEFWQKKWSLDFIKNSADELRQAEELTFILKLLADNDIEAAPLKGACLAYHHYPHPALRNMGDFDILIRPDSIKKAFQLMIDNNFTAGYDFGNCCHEAPLSSPTGFVLELHSHIDSDFERCDYNFLWEGSYKSEFFGQVISYLSPEIYLLHAINHAFKDNLVGGIRAFIDVGYILTGADINIKGLENCAERIGFYDDFILFMNIFPDFFPKKYIPDSKQFSVDLIKKSRYLIYNFKHIKGLDQKQLMLHREYNGLSFSKKILFLMKRMNTKPASIAQTYNCRIHSPMLGFYYLYRINAYFMKYVLFLKKSKQNSLIRRIGICQKTINNYLNDSKGN